MSQHYIALIPAYKPSDGLVFLLQSLKKLEFTTVLVDDGSGESYASVFAQCWELAIVLHHGQNKGKGMALKTGLRYILEHMGQNCLVVTMDADGQQMNVLLELARRKVPLKEMEIQTIYLDQNAGSHFSPVRDSLRIYKEILRFSLSSFLSFLVDYCAYTILLWLSGGLVLSNVLARVLSAGLNFYLNHRYVFSGGNKLWRAAIGYFCLAGGILLGNTLFLKLLAEGWGVPRLPAKLLTEMLFFLLNWLLQHYIVFRNPTRE